MRSSLVKLRLEYGFIIQVLNGKASSPMRKYGVFMSSPGSGSGSGKPRGRRASHCFIHIFLRICRLRLCLRPSASSSCSNSSTAMALSLWSSNHLAHICNCSISINMYTMLDTTYTMKFQDEVIMINTFWYTTVHDLLRLEYDYDDRVGERSDTDRAEIHFGWRETMGNPLPSKQDLENYLAEDDVPVVKNGQKKPPKVNKFNVDYQNLQTQRAPATQFLASLGGKDLSKQTRNVMRFVARNPVWSRFSLKGRKKKEALEKLPMWRPILNALLKDKGCPSQTDVEFQVADFLKYATHQGSLLHKKLNMDAMEENPVPK
ncbi:hypothetical protein MAR_003924 [Mya arenaria]|uniref:Uncharacterized protein n=1 Tax=Mya arenaria TaxID=6604 RepID=A0ABY7EZE6_MYAAR|nr:hypothetical protein MAR_003924 [Mya arenaria]